MTTTGRAGRFAPKSPRTEYQLFVSSRLAGLGGLRSGFATARVTTPPFCEPPRSADGVYRVAVMLFYYSDYLAVAQLPATVADARRTLFGTADNGSPNSGLFFGQVPLATEVERLRG